VTIRGGTHVPRSPCFHSLHWYWRGILHRIGIHFDLTMTTAGFHPEGAPARAGSDRARMLNRQRTKERPGTAARHPARATALCP